LRDSEIFEPDVIWSAKRIYWNIAIKHETVKIHKQF